MWLKFFITWLILVFVLIPTLIRVLVHNYFSFFLVLAPANYLAVNHTSQAIVTYLPIQGSIETKSYPTKFRQNLFHLHLHLHHGSLLRLLLKVNEETDVFGEEQMLFLKLRKGRSNYTQVYFHGVWGLAPKKMEPCSCCVSNIYIQRDCM